MKPQLYDGPLVGKPVLVQVGWLVSMSIIISYMGGMLHSHSIIGAVVHSLDQRLFFSVLSVPIGA